ncbi:hypothetical protein JYU34_003855 [Plutella xylostella]|uniref:Uncharacterized protein n=2 Tax=Plutella xylostella TaxID=51655 RepID=A0ABQ7R128_PLUXY|nr:hypothetical protein JYU34_003855 [Plutella xylostella]CAG9132407.1 unnamed protein product [Plutella xylostella]
MSTHNVSCECNDLPTRQPTPSHSQETRPQKYTNRRDHYPDRHFKSCECCVPAHSRRESPSHSRRESPTESLRESPADSRRGSPAHSRTAIRGEEYGGRDPKKPIISCLCENNPGKPKERTACPELVCCKCPKNNKKDKSKDKKKTNSKDNKKGSKSKNGSDIELICECNPDKKKK